MAKKNLEIKELNTQIGQVVIPDAAIKRLEEKEIKTLKDIRRKGGIPRFDDLPPEDEKAVKKVEAHAYISLVSEDTKVNDTLIDTDFRNTADIARLTRNDFVVKAKKAGINADIASAIHAKSTAASAVFNNVLTASRVEQANNFKVAPAVDIRDTFPAQCECLECESAVSPLAYLTDLLDYTITHVKKNTGYPIDLNTLEEEFHQPFKRYIAACEEVERKVRQVRICIEVLRSHLKDDLPYTSYLFKAYKTLLNRIGTSYDEIRLARTAAPDKREALANRLGIDLSAERLDELDALFLAYENITEQDMEKLFGLVDTTRDPLSDGAKLGDVQDQITYWNLTGVEWNKNTGAEGNIYVRLRRLILPDRIPRVYSYLYRDRKRKQLVAAGLVRNGVGTIELKERNNSGLSGNFEIKYTADTKEIEISVIPDFLSWRLKHLRTLWKEQDWPGDPYTQRVLPIIDPDVIGPDDFRLTEQNESVFELWKERREWVDQTMEQLDRDLKINGLVHILEHTLKQVLGDDPLPDLDALLKNLTKGENLEDTEDQIRSMNLTVESFTRLMEIRAKHIRAENNYESEAVNDEEWREVYSILTQALKKTWYADWIAEEQEKHVNLGPKQFWISLRQPKEGDWPPAHLVQQPVIDPERLNAEELPEPLAGGYAVVIWEARRARLDQIYSKLKAEQEERGFVAMLKLAVGDPKPGDDLPHDLDKLEKDLLYSTDPEVVATAKRNITNGLYMTVIAFKRLMSIKAKADNPDSEPTDEEWTEVYAILTSAFKLKREYPNWISQEVKLPLIEPDVLELSDLAEPTIGKRAIALWHARRAKVDRTYENLKDTGETAGLGAMLREALGEPDPGNPLPHNLTELNENLKSGDSEKVNEAAIKITNDLFMTVNDFTRLMEIKDKYVDPNTPEKPTEKEWAEVTTILTQAQKAKREYPNWKEEEQDNDIVFWSALKAKLPSWLATQEVRQQWQQALRNRSQAPIIDPDVIGEDDLKNLIDDDPAYEILEARRNWVRDQLDALEMAHGEEEAWLSWGNEGTGNGQFQKPRGVAIDSSGNVYVADSNNNRIQKFDPRGEVIDVWGGPEDGQFEKPRGVAVDSSGNVYVADTDNHRIQKFDSDGQLLKQWGEEGSEKVQFKRPSGVAVDVNSGDVYVADTRNHRIKKFNPDGGFIGEWGEEGDWEGAFKNPRGVAVDSSGKVYVADSENHRIQKFDSDGNLIAVWGQEEGNGDGEFSWPFGVAVDSSGNVYVADSNNHRIQKFDSDGRFLKQWGRQGSEDGQFKTPSGVAVDRSGNVYVADTYNNRIHACIFNLTVLEFRAIISSTLGISLKDLTDLAEERKQGNDISARLDQLSLSMTAFLYLLRIHDLLVSDAEIMYSEWDDVYSILVQVQKRRIFAEWRDVEKGKGIFMSSDFFVIPEEEPEELHPWRASWEARRDLQDKLGSRIDQEKTVCAAMAESVDACEEATLTLLRDGLVEASDAEGNDITAKAKWLTKQLLIDCQIDACQKTTRISQAIITLQKLIFSLRTGQLEDSELELDPGENFEEEWMWMSSYEFWKAAVGVFLYPENILLPGLRRQQTPAFRELVDKLRRYRRRLTPQLARDLAKEYEDYFKDVCSLSLEDTVQFDTSERIYIIARGGFTNSLYMSSYDPEDTSLYAQTYWLKIKGIENVEVIDVVGAAPGWKDQERYIYLFLKIKEEGKHKLVLTKSNNLEKGLYDQPSPLELPSFFGDFSAVVKKGRIELKPHLAIYAGHNIYARRIEGDSWEDGDWKDFVIEEGIFFSELCSMIWDTKGRYFVIIQGYGYEFPDGRFRIKRFGRSEQNSSWIILEEEEPGEVWPVWVGSISWSTSIGITIHIFYRIKGRTRYKRIHATDNEIKIVGSSPFDINIDRLKATNDYFKESEQMMQVIYANPEPGNLSYNTRQKYRSLFKLKNNLLIFDQSESKHVAVSTDDKSIKLEPIYLNENGQQLTQELFDYYYLKQDAPSSVLTYLKEAFYFVPMAIALQLQRAGQYTATLDWFRAVYDYTKPVNERKIYYWLKHEEKFKNEYKWSDECLSDPLDVHAIADSRRNTYTRFTVLSIIRSLLAYADAEFTRDTVESLAKARTLYETALELLEVPELNQHLDSCAEIIGYLEIELEGADRKGAWQRILNDMGLIRNVDVLESTADKVRQLIRSSGELSTRIAEARQVVREALNEQRSTTIGNMLDARRRILTEIPRKLLENESAEKSVEKAVLLAETARRPDGVYAPTAATLPFCIPPNPMIKALLFHAEINLHKLRTCRNIAGVKREIEAYAAPTDILSAMPSIGPGGQLVIPTRITPPPVPYRYEFLIERAKQLANMAAQMEGAFLSALEKLDAELYNQLKARQDVQLARAGVRLQDLRLHQTQDEVKLAELQQESAQIQFYHYKTIIAEGESTWETLALVAMHGAVAHLHAKALQIQIATKGFGGWGEIGQALSATASLFLMHASFERREQEWRFQQDLAQQSIRIGEQQIRIANDGVNIIRHEKNIAKMQVEHAEAIVEFLNSKFTNVELYDWMSGVLEGVYSFFLQHATSMAKLAQNQLAFERQEPPPAFIQDDYWEVPGEELMGGATENAVDRHGLTGSARLAADIYKLDQYRLETEKRKLQLTKSFSLACMAPFEFQRFRETGVITFGTLMELFDGDFPGHYLRMIKRVRTSVIALIPPIQGIKATLSNIGVSRIVTNNNGLFQPITAHRPPESVALTSPSNATGLFELESQSEMLLPFEGLGVDTAWEFRMPKAANRFDYSTIADVIITTEYTALDSFDYRQQVIETLPSKVSANRPFSFRHQFADQWYDLHNPEQTATPMCVRFRTRREDFPPNIEDLKIEHVVLYFAGAGGESSEIEATLHFRPEDGMADIGGDATSIDGVISTRRGNAGSWTVMIGKSTVGDWALTLPDTGEMKNRFKNEEIEDILFVITYSGRTPAWPD